MYRDAQGVVFHRTCAICGLEQEAPLGPLDYPRAMACMSKVRAIINAGALDELEPLVSQLHLLVTADAWRVDPNPAA